jgi:hypothetical protein
MFDDTVCPNSKYNVCLLLVDLSRVILEVCAAGLIKLSSFPLPFFFVFFRIQQSAHKIIPDQLLGTKSFQGDDEAFSNAP